MITWEMKHPKMTVEMLGYIPTFLSADDPRPAREQFNDRYVGGWWPLPKFKILPDGSIKYPGDPLEHALAEARLRDEVIRYYAYSWVSIIQPDGSVEISRMD